MTYLSIENHRGKMPAIVRSLYVAHVMSISDTPEFKEFMSIVIEGIKKSKEDPK